MERKLPSGGDLFSRIAPTPSGFLHAGNVFSFLLTWLIVRTKNGRLALRIDDSDADRRRPQYVEDIFRTLEWLEIDCDTGPAGPDDFEKNWSQEHRLAEYDAVLQDFARARPDLVFACTCSRRMLAGFDAYPGTCRDRGLPLNTPDASWRIFVPAKTAAAVNDVLQRQMSVNIGASPGSFVIRRRDGRAAYQLVSLLEDAVLRTNFIVRGADLTGSSGMQTYLADALGMSGFQRVVFLHHAVLAGPDGLKLSKSTGAESVVMRGRDEKTRIGLLREFAQWMGWPENGIVRSADLLLYAQSLSEEIFLESIPR